jgi:hypothetical protein
LCRLACGGDGNADIERGEEALEEIVKLKTGAPKQASHPSYNTTTRPNNKQTPPLVVVQTRRWGSFSTFCNFIASLLH